MTTAQARSRARGLARSTSAGLSDTDLNGLINDMLRELCEDVHGFPAEGYIDLAESFDTRTNFGVRLTIVGGANELAATDIAVTTTNRTNAAGATIASDLQATIRSAGAASATVAYTDYYFTIAASGATSITVEAPDDEITYLDATQLLFGKTGTQAAASWVGGFPEDCTVEAALPSDCLAVQSLEWDGNPLQPAPASMFMSPQTTGTPCYYTVRGTNIRLYPTPTTPKKLYIWYKKFTATISSFDTNLPTAIPAELQDGFVYLLASRVCENSWDEKQANRFLARYTQKKNRWVARKENENPKTSEPVYGTLGFTVNTDDA